MALFIAPGFSEATPAAAGAHEAQVLLGRSALIVGAKIGGHIMARLNQPVVLGELLVGILLGNLGLLGVNDLDFIQTDIVFETLASIGVILLLFEVGLESSLNELLR